MSRNPIVVRPNKKLWIIFGIVLFIVFVLSHVPATWGGYLLTRGTGLALSGITGSLWNGRASLASVRQNDQVLSLGQLSWSFRPLSLLTLSPCVDAKTKLETQEFTGELCAGFGGTLQINDANISFPAALVQARAPVPIQGNFSLDLDELRLKGNVLLKMKGKLEWVGAKVNTGSDWMDIGNYAADVTDNGKNGINAKLVETAGPVNVNLQIELTAPSGGRITGEVAGPMGFFESANAIDVLAMFAEKDRVDDEGKTHYRVDINL